MTIKKKYNSELQHVFVSHCKTSKHCRTTIPGKKKNSLAPLVGWGCSIKKSTLWESQSWSLVVKTRSSDERTLIPPRNKRSACMRTWDERTWACVALKTLCRPQCSARLNGGFVDHETQSFASALEGCVNLLSSKSSFSRMERDFLVEL